MMTVDEIMALTGQKRGTIEQFRSVLQKYRLIEKHQSLDKRAVTTFMKAVEYKEAKENNWIESIERAIQYEYGEEMVLPHIWTRKIVLKDLIWKIKNERVTVERVGSAFPPNDVHSEEYHIVFKIIIDNFEEMGKTIDTYKNSYGTDGNPITTFICKGKNFIYYIVGKYNSITKSEDIHVFYNDGLEFNLMKCEHVCGGNSDKGKLDELWKTCSSFTKDKSVEE